MWFSGNIQSMGIEEMRSAFNSEMYNGQPDYLYIAGMIAELFIVVNGTPNAWEEYKELLDFMVQNFAAAMGRYDAQQFLRDYGYESAWDLFELVFEGRGELFIFELQYGELFA